MKFSSSSVPPTTTQLLPVLLLLAERQKGHWMKMVTVCLSVADGRPRVSRPVSICLVGDAPFLQQCLCLLFGCPSSGKARYFWVLLVIFVSEQKLPYTLSAICINGILVSEGDGPPPVTTDKLPKWMTNRNRWRWKRRRSGRRNVRHIIIKQNFPLPLFTCLLKMEQEDPNGWQALLLWDEKEAVQVVKFGSWSIGSAKMNQKLFKWNTKLSSEEYKCLWFHQSSRATPAIHFNPQ